MSIKESSYRKYKSVYNFPKSNQSLKKFHNYYCIPEEFDDSVGISSLSAKVHNHSSISLTPKGSKIYALIVDDCAINRMVHHMLLSAYDFIITEHTNGKEAVGYMNDIERLNPSKVIILMDINMPIMDGIEATKAIKRKNYGVTIHIIAVSAFSNEH